MVEKTWLKLFHDSAGKSIHESVVSECPGLSAGRKVKKYHQQGKK